MDLLAIAQFVELSEKYLSNPEKTVEGVVGGVVGGRADAARGSVLKAAIKLFKTNYTEKLQSLKAPEETALQKAIRESYLQSIVQACEECVELIHGFNQDFLQGSFKEIETAYQKLKREFPFLISFPLKPHEYDIQLINAIRISLKEEIKKPGTHKKNIDYPASNLFSQFVIFDDNCEFKDSKKYTETEIHYVVLKYLKEERELILPEIFEAFLLLGWEYDKKKRTLYSLICQNFTSKIASSPGVSDIFSTSAITALNVAIKQVVSDIKKNTEILMDIKEDQDLLSQKIDLSIRPISETLENVFDVVKSNNNLILTGMDKSSDKHLIWSDKKFSIILDDSVHELIRRIKHAWKLEENIDDFYDLIEVTNRKLFLYNYNDEKTWLVDKNKISLINDIIFIAVYKGVFSESLFNLTIKYAWMLDHLNQINQSNFILAHTKKTLSEIERDLLNSEYYTMNDKVRHFEIQKDPRILHGENYAAYCSNFPNDDLKNINYLKCMSCVFIMNKQWKFANKCIGDAISIAEDLENKPSLFQVKDGLKVRILPYSYALAYHYRVMAEFYLTCPRKDLARALYYADKSIDIFEDVGYGNSHHMAIGYYQRWRIHTQTGKKALALKEYKMARKLRAESLSLHGCLVNHKQMDRDLKVNNNRY